MQARLTCANTTATIAAVVAVLAAALIAASPAHATCTTLGTPGGGPGDDRMCGTSSADSFFGQAGNDALLGGGGNDTLDGGEGNDRLDGDSGNDILIGGPGGFNGLFGGDFFEGDSGNDALRARDGELDLLNKSHCGTGTDSLDMDLADATALGAVLGLPLLEMSCENLTVGAINEGPNVVISRRSVDVGTDGRVAVRLHCPAALQVPCAGTLSIGHAPKSQGKRKHYSIDQGKKEDVSARLSGRDRRKLRRGQISASAISVEAGQFGDKTTVQTIELIAHG